MEKRTPFKKMSHADKVDYVREYLKWPIIIGAVVLIVIVSLIKNAVTYKDPTLSVMMINSVSDDKSGIDDFLISQGVTPYKEMTQLSASFYYDEEGNPVSGNYYDDMAMLTYLSSGEYDIMFGTGGKFRTMADRGFFMDIRDVLSSEAFASIPKENILYCTPESESEEYPCAVILQDPDTLRMYYPEMTFYGGIIYKGPHPDMAFALLERLVRESFIER